MRKDRGMLARMTRNWVLSETAIIEQSYESERVGVLVKELALFEMKPDLFRALLLGSH
jgi:hypothetical protein